MPTTPDLQVLYRRRYDILFGWKPLKRSEAKSYNIYAASSSGGAYTIVKSKIPNEIDKTIYRGKVVVPIKDSDIPIPLGKSIPPEIGGVVDGTNYWFKLTFVDTSNVESNIASSPPIIVRPWNEEPFFENENEVQNDHLFGWVKSRRRWEKIQLNNDGELVVDADINIDEITLGNVKVAARTDNTTLEYLLVDDNRKVIIRPDPNSNSRIADYEETTSINKNTETTILTYTNTSAYFLEKIVCSGTSDAKFKFKIDGTTAETQRNSWDNRNVTFDSSTIQRKISPTSIVTITATHGERNPQDFEVSLIGFTFTIN